MLLPAGQVLLRVSAQRICVMRALDQQPLHYTVSH